MSPYRDPPPPKPVDHKRLDEVRSAVRTLLAELEPKQRLAVMKELVAGYCRYCGEIEEPYHHSKHY